MKKALLVAILLFGTYATQKPSVAEPRFQMSDFKDLPRDHWAYSCVAKLWGLYPEEAQPKLIRPMNRYEFSVLYARVNLLLLKQPELNEPIVTDILSVFQQEFRNEISKLTPLDTLGYDPERRVPAPPRLTFRPYISNGHWNYYLDGKEPKSGPFSLDQIGNIESMK